MDWIIVLLALFQLSAFSKGQGQSREKKHELPKLDKSSHKWSGVSKPQPASGDEDHGIYDLEVQPGDEERIYHYESKKLRPLDAKVKRWEYVRQKGQVEGCGFPICILLDGTPWRFRSICDFIRYLQYSKVDHSRRLFHIQKGDCADAIEGIGWKNPWGNEGKGCHQCKENEHCNTKVCWAKGNKSKTYSNICELLSDITSNVISGWIGIGDCNAFFTSGTCINTEWFDIDHPCGVGDIEQTRTNILYTKTFKKTGSSRMCNIENIQGNMDIRTVEGGNLPTDQVLDRVESSSHSYEGDQLICKNSRQTKKPQAPFFWPYSDVKCRDYKVRHCCRGLFGSIKSEAGQYHNHSAPFKIVTPQVKTLFDECEWKPFVSNCYPKEHDQEDRATMSKGGYKKHVCGSPIFNSMFIDARRREDDTPYYETGEKLTKVSPTYGLLCSNVNNQYSKRNCSDYKVRFCCAKNPPASWGSWGAWSKCSKSCNKGFRKATRQCKHNNHKHSCYGKKIRAFRERTESCNELPCPEDAILSPWRSWSPCSTTCGLGERRRTRICEEGRYKGKSCPEDFRKYFQIEQCPKQLPCPIAVWAKWTSWNKCSASCGYGVKRRTRICIDMYTKRELGTRMHCLGGSHLLDERCFPQKCTTDGGWTAWLSWEDCNILCGPHGKRVRRRYCANPIPSHGGKECKGDKIQSGKCPKTVPCPVHCTWSTWGHWTKCSLSCGPIGSGYRERRRHVAVEASFGGLDCDQNAYLESENCPHCEHKKSKHCIANCPIDCEWSSWTVIGECLSCYHDEEPPRHLKKYPAKKVRFVKRNPRYGGKECGTKGASQDEDFYLDCSKIPKCPHVKGSAIWSQWSQWGICTGVCGGKYHKKRTRECIPTAKDSKCPGKSSQIHKCKKICDELGWSDWEGWSKCPVTCGKGKRTRKRECYDKKQEGKYPCHGQSKETNYCDCGPCNDEGYAIQTEGENALDFIKKRYDLRSTKHKTNQLSNQNSDEFKDDADEKKRKEIPTSSSGNQDKESLLTADNSIAAKGNSELGLKESQDDGSDLSSEIEENADDKPSTEEASKESQAINPEDIHTDSDKEATNEGPNTSNESLAEGDQTPTGDSVPAPSNEDSKSTEEGLSQSEESPESNLNGNLDKRHHENPVIEKDLDKKSHKENKNTEAQNSVRTIVPVVFGERTIAKDIELDSWEDPKDISYSSEEDDATVIENSESRSLASYELE